MNTTIANKKQNYNNYIVANILLEYHSIISKRKIFLTLSCLSKFIFVIWVWKNTKGSTYEN